MKIHKFQQESVYYLPSPPQAVLGVITTSLQLSVSVLYTYSFRPFPSWLSIREKRSSDCRNRRTRR